MQILGYKIHCRFKGVALSPAQYFLSHPVCINCNLRVFVVKKDTQRDHITTKVAAAATFCVCRTIHSGEITLVVNNHTQESLPE